MKTIVCIILILTIYQIESIGQERNDMLIHERLEHADSALKATNFTIDKKEYNRIVSYQMKKYKLDQINQHTVEEGLDKWHSINSINDSIFIYIPPKPDVPRKLLITKNAVISYYHDGMSVQLIKELVKVSENKYRFKLCHNQKSPFEDGYVPAELTILNAKKGISMWKEWRRINEPFTLFFIRHDKSHSVMHLKNRKEEIWNIGYLFDNKLLNEMGQKP